MSYCCSCLSNFPDFVLIYLSKILNITTHLYIITTDDVVAIKSSVYVQTLAYIGKPDQQVYQASFMKVWTYTDTKKKEDSSKH